MGEVKLDEQSIIKARDMLLQMEPYDRPPIMRRQSPLWEGRKVMLHGRGSPPRGYPIPYGYTLQRDPVYDEWAIVEEPKTPLQAAAKDKPEPDKETNEKIAALEATVNLLKTENVNLWQMLEALARRMDRIEFNAEIEDDGREREDKEPTAVGSGGTGSDGLEDQSISIGDGA